MTVNSTVSDKISRDSFEELAMPLFDSLYNFARWLAQNNDEAEDVVQETYVKALKGFRTFRQGTNFRAWIFRILRNTFLTSRAELQFRMTESADFEDGASVLQATSETPEFLLIERSTQRLLQTAIEELPVVFREVILLREVEEMSYQEIAEAISVPIGTVMSRLARGRNALRSSLRKLQTAQGPIRPTELRPDPYLVPAGWSPSAEK